MCDEFTAEAEEANLARRGLNRREFAALGASAALAGCAVIMPKTGGSDVKEKMVTITTADGIADAFYVHPGKGRHPAIIMWPDIAGLREVKKIMARTLAAEGFSVLCVNPYYRGGPAPTFDNFSQYRTPEGQAKVAPLRAALTPDAITRDAKAYVSFLRADKAVDSKRGIGSSGYCMGGPFTVRTAAAEPTHVRAAASFHGAGLVAAEPDSPHRLMARTDASFLFAIARNDDEKNPAQKVELAKSADAAKRPAEVEVYPADHGWCVPDSPAWDPTAADKAWQRMLVLFGTL